MDFSLHIGLDNFFTSDIYIYSEPQERVQSVSAHLLKKLSRETFCGNVLGKRALGWHTRGEDKITKTFV